METKDNALRHVAILTSPQQWFIPYAERLAQDLHCDLYLRHEDVPSEVEILFILSYHRIIPESYLEQHQHNLVIHASPLPAGKGWAPLTWQVLEGKNDIVFSLFEADSKVDNGLIYLRKTLHLTGYELCDELRTLQAQFCIEMCKDYLERYHELKGEMPQGESTFYRKRTPEDSCLNLEQSLGEQFNLLRCVDNELYPAYFIKDGHKYILKIYHADPA